MLSIFWRVKCRHFCCDACKCLDKLFEIPPSSFFQAALYAAPYRSDFLKALSKGREVKDEECLDKVRQFLVNFTVTIDAIYEMYTRMNAELDYTVWSLVHKLQTSTSSLPVVDCCLPLDVSSLDRSSFLPDPASLQCTVLFSLEGQLGSKLLKTLAASEGRMSAIVCSAHVDGLNALAFL